jgi:hypothetical protein
VAPRGHPVIVAGAAEEFPAGARGLPTTRDPRLATVPIPNEGIIRPGDRNLAEQERLTITTGTLMTISAKGSW